MSKSCFNVFATYTLKSIKCFDYGMLKYTIDAEKADAITCSLNAPLSTL